MRRILAHILFVGVVASDFEPDETLVNLTRWYADESFYGADDQITQLAHALQAARQAELAGAPEAVVVGALLHDVGWKLAGVDGRVDTAPGETSMAAQLGILSTTTGGAEARARHDAVGAAYLRRAGFDELAVRMVEGHVESARKARLDAR